MSKKLKIFYIIDLLFIVLSLIGMIILNNKVEYGLSALTGVGQFVICLIAFIVSIVLNVVISLIFFISRLKNGKGKQIEK